MFCAQCGTLVSANSRFCVACGTRVTDPNGGARAGTLTLTQPAEEQLLTSVRRALAAEYDVERELGRGGMAVVFKARDKELDRTVALKVLPLELMPVATVADRFKREARLAASLDHPHIIPVYRVGQAGGVLYMAMKFIDGQPLDAVVASRGPLPLPVVLTVLRAAASAIAYSHEHGIVHRDIKGANILIDRGGRVVVSDFGIARAVESATLTATGAMIGTPHFMSPEQCAGKPVGPQSDQYSLGIVAYQMSTGVVPFDGDSLPEILQHHWFTPAPDASLIRPDIPAALTAVILRLMAKDPADRFASTGDLVASLDAIPFSPADRAAGHAALKALVTPDRTVAPRIPTVIAAATTAAAPVVATPVAPVPAAAVPVAARPVAVPAPAAPVAGRLVAGGSVAATRVLVASESPAVSLPSLVSTAQAPGPPTKPIGGAIRQPLAAPRRKPAKRRSPMVLVACVVVLGVLAGGFVLKAKRAAGGATRGWSPNAGLGGASGSSATPPRLDARLMREAGGKAYQAGDYELARRFFVRAVIADPKEVAGQRELGCDFLKLGRADSAAPHFSLAHMGPKPDCR